MTQHASTAVPSAAFARRWLALAVLLIANIMVLIDVTIVNVALPSIQADLVTSDSHLQWIVAGYILAFALGLLPSGRSGDMHGRRKVFITGVALFSAASAACGLSPNVETLIAARAIQGLGGAMMASQALAIISVTFKGAERGRAFALFGLSAGLASVCGPILGGALIAAAPFGMTWEAVFLVNVPVGCLAVAAGLVVLPALPGDADLRNDFIGIAIFVLGVVGLVFPLIEGPNYGWPAWGFGMMAVGAALLGTFSVWTRAQASRGAPQLLSYSLLTNGDYALGVIAGVIFASGTPAMFLVIAVMLQEGYGFAPLESGMTNTPFSVGIVVASVLTSRLKVGSMPVRLAAASLMLVVGLLWLQYVLSNSDVIVAGWSLLPPLLLAGLGMGLGFSSLFPLVMRSVPAAEAGAASGALQALQHVSAAIGVAIVGAIFFSTLGAADRGQDVTPPEFATAAAVSLWYQIVAFGIVFALAFGFRRGASKGSDSPGAKWQSVAEGDRVQHQ